MHLLQRNHRSWILTAFFVAVTHVHRGECDDGVFKSILQNGKTGFLKTYEKTYHTKYEFDLNDALHQTGRFLRKLTRPVVTVETDPTLINEEQLQDTAFDLEDYCDSDEDELTRAHHNAGSHSKPEVLHENSAGEDRRGGEEDRLHAKQGIFNIGKLFFKPTIFNKKLQKKVQDPDAFHRDGQGSEDPLSIQQPNTLHSNGNHNEDPLKMHDLDTFHRAGHHSKDPLNIHDPDPFHSDGHHSEDPLNIHDHSGDHLNTTTNLPSAGEHHTSKDGHQMVEHENQIFNFGKLFSSQFFKRTLQKIIQDRLNSHRDRPHSEDHLNSHEPNIFHSDGHHSEDLLKIHDPDHFHSDEHHSEDPLNIHDPDTFHRDGNHSEDPLKMQDLDTFHRVGHHSEDPLNIHDPVPFHSDGHHSEDRLNIHDLHPFHSDGLHSEDHLNTTKNLPSAGEHRTGEDEHRTVEHEHQIFNIRKLLSSQFFKRTLQKIIQDRLNCRRDRPHSEDHLNIHDPDTIHSDGHHREDPLNIHDLDLFHSDGHHSEDLLKIHDPDPLLSDGHHSEDHLNTTKIVSSAAEHHTAEEEHRTAEHEDQIFNLGKLLFNSQFFKRILQNMIHAQNASHRDGPHSGDHLKTHDPDIYHRDGLHSDDDFKIHDSDLLQALEHHSEDHPNTTGIHTTGIPLTKEEPVNVWRPLPSPVTINTDTVPIHDQHTEGLLHRTGETKVHSDHLTGGHLNTTEVPGTHSAEDGQIHPFSILNLFKKNLGRTLHRPDTIHSHDHHSGVHVGATEPAEVASTEEDPTTEEEEDHLSATEEDPIVGKPLLKSRLSKRLHKPVMVSVLKNFKLLFNIPIKFSKYEAKHSLEPPAITQTHTLAQTQAQCEDYCDGDLIT